MGTSNTQDYSRHIIGIFLPGSLYSSYIPATFLGFPVWGSHWDPTKLKVACQDHCLLRVCPHQSKEDDGEDDAARTQREVVMGFGLTMHSRRVQVPIAIF